MSDPAHKKSDMETLAPLLTQAFERAVKVFDESNDLGIPAARYLEWSEIILSGKVFAVLSDPAKKEAAVQMLARDLVEDKEGYPLTDPIGSYRRYLQEMNGADREKAYEAAVDALCVLQASFYSDHPAPKLN